MGASRRWRTWPKRFKDEVNGISGVAGIGGTAMAVGSWALVTGPVGVGLVIGGLVLSGVSVAYASIKAIPPQLLRPEAVAHTSMPQGDVDSIDPPLSKLAIIGPSKAGKTTLRERLAIQRTNDLRTQNISAYVLPLSTQPQIFVAVLDASGEVLSQQFRIAESADMLCIVLDHNESDTEFEVRDDRLADHAKFLDQVRSHLRECNGKRLQWVLVLKNKRDLWEAAPAQQRQHFADFCLEQAKTWRSGNFADAVTEHAHSNEIPNDVADVAALIATRVRS
jgi:hypothetical protein